MIKLKELRLSKQLSQSELAKMLGCNQTAVGKYERGQLEPNIETLKLLSRIFEVSIDYILCNSDELENITFPTGQLTDQLPNDEQRLLYTYRKLEKIDKDKLIDDAEYFARRSSQNSNLKI